MHVFLKKHHVYEWENRQNIKKNSKHFPIEVIMKKMELTCKKKII